VVDADHRGLIDVGVLDETVLDFDGIDVLAASDDHVPAPAFQEEQATGDSPVVAGTVPAVLVKDGLGGGRVVPVTEEYRR
jgi:hypothetical protein